MVEQIHAELERFFRVNIDADTVAGTHPWFQQTIDKLFCGLKVLFKLVQLAPNDFEQYRDQVELCTHILSLILRRAGRELQEPGSSVCKTPAWFYKEVKDGEKAKEDRSDKKRSVTDDSKGASTPTAKTPKVDPKSAKVAAPPISATPPVGTVHAWYDEKQGKWHYGKKP